MRAAFLLVLAATALASAGCGPSDECRRYVACQNAYDPNVSTTVYEEGGACWTTLQTSQECTAQCTAALDALASLEDAPPECTR